MQWTFAEDRPMDASANLDLPFIMPSQAAKHVTHNEALARLDALVQLTVRNRDLTEPPAAPDDGDRYLVACAATGAWTGWDLSVASFYAGAWLRFDPLPGWLCWIADENLLAFWDGAAWQPLAAASIGAVSKAGDVLSGGLVVAAPGVHYESEIDGAGTPLRATRWIDSTAGAVVFGRKARGTREAPAAPQADDTLFGFRAYGYNGTGGDGFISSDRGAAFLLEAAEDWSGVRTGTQIRFFVTPTGNSALSSAIEHTRLASDGSLCMGGSHTVISAERHPVLRSYTLSALPPAAPAGQLIYVANGAGNRHLAVSDGSVWRWPDGSSLA